MIKMKNLKFDFLIIGGGLTGLYSALYASKFGKVALLTKSTLEISNSYLAQGGIAAVVDPHDSFLYHFNDTIKAGRGLCNTVAVEILVQEGRNVIKNLIDMGMEFDHQNKEIALGMEGGHSRRRILHAGGSATGKMVVDFLISKIKNNDNVSIFENFYTYKLISDNTSCYGAYALDLKSKECFAFISKATILATGGTSGIYLRTTNPTVSTGDGIALAYQAGAEIIDMEFIQFHPTALYLEHGEAFLITEAIRGEGAYLVNHKNERFMPKYHKLAELAPRDVVSKSIFNEMKLENKNNIFLKLDHLDAEYIKKRFVNIYNELKKYGLDLTKDPIPVAPAAHYTIGGIKSGYNAETNIFGLLAAGEVSSTGIHGANRLASNSLPECMVFGKRAIDYANKYYNVNPPNILDEEILNIDYSFENDYKNYNHFIADLMTKNVGIVRSEGSISYALREIEKLKNSLALNPNEYYSNMLIKLLAICELISTSALERHESRGVHIREDFPEENPEYLFHIIQQINKTIRYLPVEPNNDYVW